MVQYFMDYLPIIVKYLRYLTIRYDIPESHNLQMPVDKPTLNQFTFERDVVVPYSSRQKLILRVDVKLQAFTLCLNNQFFPSPKSASLDCRVNDPKVCQKSIILLTEFPLLHENHQIFRFILLELLGFFLEKAEIEGYSQIGQVQGLQGKVYNFFVIGMPLLLPQSLDHNFPMLYFVLYLNLSLQVLKVLLGGCDMKVPKRIDYKFIVRGLPHEDLHLFGEHPRSDALFAVFEIVLFVIFIQLQRNIATVSQFFVRFERIVSDGAGHPLGVGLVCREGEQLAELPRK